MRRQRKCKKPSQLEFSALVEAAENASRELFAQRRARRRVEREQRKALRLLKTPWLSKNGFDEAWLKSARKRIETCDTLREGIILAASRLSELIDMTIDEEELDPEWKGKYDAFCAHKKIRHAGTEREEDKMLCVFWEMSREIFETYYALNSMDDWTLFERVCSGDMDDLEATDFLGKQTSLLKHYSSVVYLMHMLIFLDFSEGEGGTPDQDNSKN